MSLPPKPQPRPDKVSLWQYLRLFRKDILSAQPARLYGARMAEFRAPLLHSALINEPELIAEVLEKRPMEFPKSGRVAAGLIPLLGRRSVFLTNGADWQRQRRILDPAFEGGRIKDSFPAMLGAVSDAVQRLQPGQHDLQPIASHLAADIIFRSLFSMPITEATATEIYEEFQAYQHSAPIVNLAAFIPWLPPLHRPKTLRSARKIRRLISGLVTERLAQIESGTAPDDLATRIMTAIDPETGQSIGRKEMIDQVAIFLLAGHETSAAALAWALYLIATGQTTQEAIVSEVEACGEIPTLSDISSMKLTRDAFREALRLYPPVPMMVRHCEAAEEFRGRKLPRGAQIVVSPWHLHRNPRHWDDPDAFCPERFSDAGNRDTVRNAYLPFSKGARVCVGAGFAMTEGVVALAMILRAFEVSPVPGKTPEPRAHLTVRSANGIWLNLTRRATGSS